MTALGITKGDNGEIIKLNSEVQDQFNSFTYSNQGNSVSFGNNFQYEDQHQMNNVTLDHEDTSEEKESKHSDVQSHASAETQQSSEEYLLEKKRKKPKRITKDSDECTSE